MTTFTEGAHAGEFILSEANGQRSRENGTLLSGLSLAAGTPLMLNGDDKLVEFDANDTATDGSLQVETCGVLIAPSDATDGDLAVAYLARDAEVNGNLINYQEETTTGGEEAHTIASLALLGIIVR
jgi:hypothetical protein